MNEYEMMTVFHPRLNADETNTAVAALEEQIVANGGEMLGTDTSWGRRRLAYPIDGVVDGSYVLYTFKMPAEGTRELERWIGLSESTIRHLLIRGIIPFEGDRHGRDDRDDRDRDDRDRDDRDRDGRDRDDRGRDDRDRGGRGEDEGRSSETPAAATAPEAAEEPRAEAAAPEPTPAAAADAPAEASSDEGDGEAAATAPDAEAPADED